MPKTEVFSGLDLSYRRAEPSVFYRRRADDVSSPPELLEQTPTDLGLQVFAAKAQGNLLRTVAKNNLKDKDNEPLVDRLELQADRRMNNGTGQSTIYGQGVILDADHALLLQDRTQLGRVLAIAGIEIKPDNITIRQLQGRKGAEKTLRQLGRWERTLVQLTEEAARALNIPEVRVRPADQIGWVKTGRYPLRSAKIRYDVTAKRMGYVWDEKVEKYVKRL